MNNKAEVKQLSFNISGPYSDREKQFVTRNLHLTNSQLAERLSRSEGSIRKFLSSEQIRRTDEQLQQIRMRVGENQKGENNPNFKN